MAMFKQRGNLTECVQWTGFNLDEVKEFLAPRLSEELQKRHVEFIETLFRHLLIVVNFGISDAAVAGNGKAIKRGTWLVDQGPHTEGPFGVVFCEQERFEDLYEEASDV